MPLRRRVNHGLENRPSLTSMTVESLPLSPKASNFIICCKPGYPAERNNTDFRSIPLSDDACNAANSVVAASYEATPP